MVTGHSNGGMMAMRMMRDSSMPSLIVPTSALMHKKLIYPDYPDTRVRRSLKPIPTFHTVGAADRFITGQITGDTETQFSISETRAEFVRALGNSGTIRERFYDDEPGSYDLHPTGAVPYGDYLYDSRTATPGKWAEQVILANAGHCWHSAAAKGSDPTGKPCSILPVYNEALRALKEVPQAP